jgi:hypothetical protein
MDKTELLRRMGLSYKGKLLGGRKADHLLDVQKLFVWVQKFPAWYLRKRLWALQLRYYAGVRIREKVIPSLDIGSKEFAPKWLSWASPKATQLNKEWSELTMESIELADIWNKTPGVREIYRAPLAGYEQWENSALDLSFRDSTVTKEAMLAIVDSEGLFT